MIISIKIKDETFEKYALDNKKDPRAAVEEAVERFSDIRKMDRVVLVPAPERQEIEKLLGRGIEVAKDLVTAITRLVRLKVGEVEVPITESQQKRILTLAEHQRRDVKEYTKQTVARAIQQALGV